MLLTGTVIEGKNSKKVQILYGNMIYLGDSYDLIQLI